MGLTRTQIILGAVAALGGLLLTAGVWQIYRPAAFVVAGVLLIAAALDVASNLGGDA